MAGKNPPLDEALLEALTRSGLAPSALLPTFLEVARRQAAARRPRDLLTQQGSDAFVGPSPVDLRTSVELDRIALAALPEFEAVLLSPLAPLGTCSVVSPTHQDRAVATARATEVISDPTNALALLCAHRLRHAGTTRVRMCTAHQVVRPQRFPAKSGFTQHFRMLALAEAGMATADHGFEVRAVVEHAIAFQRVFDALEGAGYAFPNRTLTLHVQADAKPIGDRVRRALEEALPKVPVNETTFTSNYYAGIRLLTNVDDRTGAAKPIADTGVFDWMATLTANRKARFIASGMGIQLVPLLFRND